MEMFEGGRLLLIARVTDTSKSRGQKFLRLNNLQPCLKENCVEFKLAVFQKIARHTRDQST